MIAVASGFLSQLWKLSLPPINQQASTIYGNNNHDHASVPFYYFKTRKIKGHFNSVVLFLILKQTEIISLKMEKRKKTSENFVWTRTQ